MLSYWLAQPVFGQQANEPWRERTMKIWHKPKIVEIAVGNEINAYACAKL